ncbi:phosphotransferase [Brucella anthropi]|uniref:phosphotransferase n=1 Tax=Brucella anthropi TaxID=529 RepID=UPI001F40EDB7|nr:phosphotransferase [Brucella anthropi]
MMHPDQLHIDADLVRVLIADQFPQYGREKVEKLETTGTVNAIFRVGSNIAARFPLQATNPAEYAKILRNEAAAMAEFAQHSPVPAPQPMGIGHPARNYPMPWMMQSWIEGDVATPDGLSTSNNFALDTANLIASLRLTDTKAILFQELAEAAI